MASSSYSKKTSWSNWPDESDDSPFRAEEVLDLEERIDDAFETVEGMPASVPDADGSTKGKVKLAGDLGGTADSPTVPGLAGKVDSSDPRLSDARTPSGAAGGDLGGSYPNPTIGTGKVGTTELADNAVTQAKASVGSGSTQLAGGDDARFPTAGQKNALAGTSGLPGVGNEFVTNGDSRLSNSRVPSGSAGGDLAGTYPNPTVGSKKVTAAKIADSTITHSQVAAANRDGAAGTPSMRTLGTGAQQAAAGNDSRLSDARTPTAHDHAPGDVKTTGGSAGDVLTIDSGAATWKAPSGGGAIGDWKTVAGDTVNGWENGYGDIRELYGPGQADHDQVLFRQEPGAIRLAGLLLNDNGTANKTMFTLPVGYRPSFPVEFYLPVDNYGTFELKTYVVNPDGTVVAPYGPPIGSARDLSFIVFPTA